nr:DUF4157 domain-containing protein [Streptomyces alanosinicus]
MIEDAHPGHDAGHGHDTTVQRTAAPATAGVQRSSVPDVLRGPGRPLDDTVRSDMEARLGADFSDVRLHTGPAARRSAAEIGARAYTSGSHVVIGDGGGDRHTLAHELTHVIQQRQGPVAGTDHGDGLRISDPSDRFERAAEANARRVLTGPAPAAGPDVQRSTGGQNADRGVVQRYGDGDVPFEHAEYYARTGWQQAAETFEQRLGGYAFAHPKSLTAARRTVARLKRLLTEYAKAERKDTAKANKSFFTDDRTSGGQVGEKLTTAEINNFFTKEGNVRELMTAVYNAAYYNTTQPGAEDKLSLKAVLNNVIGPKPQYAATLGMNKEEVKKHSDFLNSWGRTVAGTALSGTKVGYNYAKDPYALGNLIWQSDSEYFLGDTAEMINSQGPRVKRSDADRDDKRKTPEMYRNAGAPLSARELAFAGRPGPHDKLPWIEGSAYYEINQESGWAKANASRGIPMVAGMSGTTTRMLKTFQWLNVDGVSPFDFRMALMGWMLPSWDHSLYEILRGSWVAGVKGPKESVLRSAKGAALMYQNIAPFTEEELRQHVCVDGQFPHELMYLAEAGRPRVQDPRASGFMEPGPDGVADANDKYQEFLAGDAAGSPLAKWKADNGNASTAGLAKKFKLAHATALMTYTGGAHQMINAAVRSRLLPEGYAPFGSGNVPAVATAEFFSLREIIKQLRNAARDPDHESLVTIDEDPVIEPQLAAAQGPDGPARTNALAIIDRRIDEIAPILFEELKAHADMTMDAMTRLPGVTGKVYRGDWNLGGVEGYSRYGKYAALNYRPGAIFTTSFDSTSRKEDVGLDFMRRQKVDGVARHRILLELTLNGKYGRDIDPFHKYQGSEDEVLLLPGASFRVTASEWRHDPGHLPANGGTDWYEHVIAEET